MPSRRPHTKTRRGCSTCKQRKVRCDQGLPVCRSCTRLAKACVYPQDLCLPPGPRTDRSQDLDIPSLHSSITDESISNLELMHYWTIRTSLTMFDIPKLRTVWQDAVPKHALSHRFLLHGIFALTALHRSQDLLLMQRHLYVKLARKHHTEALSHYIPSLQNITPQNCHAIFAFSALIGALSYGLLRLPEHESESDPKSELYTDSEPENIIKGCIAIFDLLQGSKLIGTEASEWLKEGDMGPYIQPRTSPSTPASPLEAASPPGAWGPQIALEALLGRVQSTMYADSSEGSFPDTSSKETKTVYVSSIQALLSVLPASSNDRPSVSSVFKWPATVDQSYITLLKAREAKALIILYHYGSVLCRLERFWWLQGIGERLHGAIRASINPEWRAYLLQTA